MSLSAECAHPGAIIKQKLIALGITQTSAAHAMRVSLKCLCAIVNGRSGISPGMAIRLSIVVGGSAEYWMSLQARHDLSVLRTRMAKIFSKLQPIGDIAQ